MSNLEIDQNYFFMDYGDETFEKGSILFEFKKGEDFNRQNTSSILRIKI